MSWLVFALLSLLGWGFADLFYKKAAESAADGSEKYSHLKTAVWVGIVMGAGAFCLLPFSESAFSVSTLVTGFVRYTPASFGYIISMIIGYAGLRYLELSIVSPVQNASGALSAIAMSLWFIIFSDNALDAISEETGFTFGKTSGSELFNNILICAGIAVIAAGVIALAVVEQRISRDTSDNNSKYRIGALALLFPLLYCVFDTVGTAADGIILSDDGMGLGELDVLVLYGFTFMAAGIVCWAVIRIKSGKFYNPFAKSERCNMYAALCEEAGQIAYVFAMAKKPVLAAPVIASYCIVSVILSRIFIHEKLKASQYACVFAVIAGIIMLGISEGISS